MAARNSHHVEDLLCPLCYGLFNVPVLLNCGHNICKVCLQKYWEWKRCRECPVCGVETLPGRPPINLQLKIAADEHQVQRIRGTPEVCCFHNEKLNVFCHNDEEPICLVCQTSSTHKVHECNPVEEAARKKRVEFSDLLESLKKKLKMLNKTKEQWEKTNKYIQLQASQCEKAIKVEFEKLRLFLQEEENSRVNMLRQEEKMKKQIMCEKLGNLEDQIQTLSTTISDIETTLRMKDLPFLHDYKETKKNAKVVVREPECIRDILVDSAKYLGLLKYKVWRKMADIIRHVPVTLDPNTAQSNLKFSEELTCVQYSCQQLLPDNPERCTSRVCVLGAKGLRWGKHSWTVEVGKGKNWHIGVAQESIKRKTAVFLVPTEGFWVIGHMDGDSYWAETASRFKLMLKQKPEMITVKVDYDKGKVVFINATDLSIIHTFTDRFTERIFPFFSPGLYDETKSSSPLKICPLNIRVDVE